MNNATVIAQSVLDILWSAQTETERRGNTKPAISELTSFVEDSSLEPSAMFTVDTPLGRFRFDIRELDPCAQEPVQ